MIITALKAKFKREVLIIGNTYRLTEFSVHNSNTIKAICLGCVFFFLMIFVWLAFFNLCVVVLCGDGIQAITNCRYSTIVWTILASNLLIKSSSSDLTIVKSICEVSNMILNIFLSFPRCGARTRSQYQYHGATIKKYYLIYLQKHSGLDASDVWNRSTPCLALS